MIRPPISHQYIYYQTFHSPARIIYIQPTTSKVYILNGIPKSLTCITHDPEIPWSYLYLNLLRYYKTHKFE